jgi:hypothetical protein
MMDYLIEADGSLFRIQIETHAALAQGLLFRESELCRVTFHGIHWFEDTPSAEGR